MTLVLRRLPRLRWRRSVRIQANGHEEVHLYEAASRIL